MPRGGRRPGAGRPRKYPLKEGKPLTPIHAYTSIPSLSRGQGQGQGQDGGKPLSLSGAPEARMGWETLEKTPGVVVSSQAMVEPEKARGWVIREAGPKSVYAPWTTATSTSYAGMNKYYREYRRDSLVRSCIDTLAFFATNKGFETELEPAEKVDDESRVESLLEKYRFVEDMVDRVNARVHLDHVLRIAVIKAKVFGKGGFEILYDGEGLPERLIPLDSTRLKPDLNAEWRLTGFTYNDKKGFYSPQEVLYFANHMFEADWEGLSDIEPIMDPLETRRTILAEAMKEAAKVMWAGIGVHTVDTSGLTDAEAEQALENHRQQIKPGKHIITNQKISVQLVDLKPDLEKLIAELEYLDQEIIGNFQVPRFLIGREKQFNRATAYAELEAFVNGPIADIQRWLRRSLEDQWYNRIVQIALKLGEKERPPIIVKHRWLPISTADYAELIQASSQLADGISRLYGQGLGAVSKDQASAFVKKLAELLGIPETEV